MKDSEFYTAPESWPQPPDEDQTLWEGTVTASAAKPKKKAAGRIRKKMSESLAGVTAAAIAVVMVANALPSLKDSFADLEDIVGEICPMCGVEGCPYYYEGREGLTLSYDGRPEYLEYDHYDMNGFTERDNATWEYCTAILTEDLQRLLLYADKKLTSNMKGHRYVSWFASDHAEPADGRPAVTGFRTICRDANTDEYKSSVYVYLIYTTDGDFSGYDIGDEVYSDGVEMEWLDERAFPVEGIPNARIYVYSDLGDEFLDAAIDYFHAEVADGPGVQLTLGDSMYFQETETCYRTYHDYYFGGSTSGYLFNEDGEEISRYFYTDFYTKEYCFTHGFSIEFAPDSWVKIFEKYAQLNEDAPKYGHEAYFPILYLGRTSVNKITYLCYVAYADGYLYDESNYRITCLLVPEQEPNIVFVESGEASPEEITAMLAGELPAEYILEQYYTTLSQVTLQ